MTHADVDAAGSQLPLVLRAPPDQRLDRYLDAPPGLIEQLRALAAGGVAGGVFLCGPRSSGKTHLLLAACTQAEELGRRAVYLSLRGLHGRVAAALQDLAAELVAVDDLDAVVGSRADEIALFDHHNRQRDARCGLLYAAAAPPDAIPWSLPDLRSRLAQCARWQLPMLDDGGRAQMLRLRAAARGLDFEAVALDWMLQRCSRDPGSLAALFERLDRASLAEKKGRLTVPFLRQVLEARVGPPERSGGA